MECTLCIFQSYTFVAPINHRKHVKIFLSNMLASFLLHRCNKMVNSVPQSTNKNCIWPVRNDYIQNMVSIISKSELYLVSAVRVVLGFQLWVCVSVEPMWVWWFGSNVYQMTMKRLLWLNNPEEILWLGSNLLSHEPQVDSQMAASVQNSLSLQETSVDWVLYCVSPLKQQFTSKHE